MLIYALQAVERVSLLQTMHLPFLVDAIASIRLDAISFQAALQRPLKAISDFRFRRSAIVVLGKAPFG